MTPVDEATTVLDGHVEVLASPLRGWRRCDPIPEWVWTEPAMLPVLAGRDMCAVYTHLQHLGLSQRRIGARTGQSQGEVAEIIKGRRIISYDVLVRIAHGLNIPRGYLGLLYQTSGPAPTDHLSAEDHVATRCCPACAPTPVFDTWTGREARALREAMRFTVRGFATYLGVTDRTVSKWEAAGASCRPRPDNQAALDTALARAEAGAMQRFTATLRDYATAQAHPGGAVNPLTADAGEEARCPGP
jgi:transcriptional regulator with XRE-family HTH domain